MLYSPIFSSSVVSHFRGHICLLVSTRGQQCLFLKAYVCSCKTKKKWLNVYIEFNASNTLIEVIPTYRYYIFYTLHSLFSHPLFFVIVFFHLFLSPLPTKILQLQHKEMLVMEFFFKSKMWQCKLSCSFKWIWRALSQTWASLQEYSIHRDE